MLNFKLALRTLFKSPFVTVVAVVSLALGIGANTAIFSLFHQLILRSLPVQEPARLVNLSAPGPKPGSQSCNQAGDCDVVFSYPMFRDLERVQATFHWNRGAPSLWRQPRLPGPDAERRRRVRVGQLLSGARHAARTRPAARSRRRSFDRRVSGRSAQPRVVAVPVRRRSERAQRDDHRQRTVADHRRRGATELHGHDARLGAAGVRAHHPARHPAAGVQALRRSPHLLGLRFRAPEARRLARSGEDSDQRALQADRERRGGAAPEGHERPDHGPVQGQGHRDGGRLARAELGPRRSKNAAPAPPRRNRARPHHRVRQHRQPAPRARRRARQRDGDPPLARREPAAARHPAARRVVPARGARRRGRLDRRPLDARLHHLHSARRRGRDPTLVRRYHGAPFCRWAHARHGPALRLVPGAAQHAARSGVDAQGPTRVSPPAPRRPSVSARHLPRLRSRSR